MPRKKEHQHPVFKAVVDGLEREYAFVYPALNIPGKGKMTAEQIIADEEVLSELIATGPGDAVRILSEKKPEAKSTTKKKSK